MEKLNTLIKEFEKDPIYLDFIEKGLIFYRVNNLKEFNIEKEKIPKEKLYQNRYSGYMIRNVTIEPQLSKNGHIVKKRETFLTAPYIIEDQTDQIIGHLPIIEKTKETIDFLMHHQNNYALYSPSITLIYDNEAQAIILYKAIQPNNKTSE